MSFFNRTCLPVSVKCSRRTHRNSGSWRRRRELGALLDQVNVRKTGNLLAKVRHADQLAENEPGIVEAQRLVEAAGDEVVAGRCPDGGHVDSPHPLDAEMTPCVARLVFPGVSAVERGPTCCFGGHAPNDSAARFPG